MANTKISQLPTYTGDTTGVYVVMDNSGLTQSYKVLNSSLGIPPWVSAGTIQSVGWSGTTTAPTVGTTTWNNISYRQLGVKEWEIVMSYSGNGSGANAGSGDYLFQLPNGLSFDTTLSSQQIFTSSVQSSNANFPRYIIPSGTGMVTDGGGSTSTNFAPIIWNSTYFRIMAYIPGSVVSCIGSPYFSTTSTAGFQLTFQFTSL